MKQLYFTVGLFICVAISPWSVITDQKEKEERQQQLLEEEMRQEQEHKDISSAIGGAKGGQLEEHDPGDKAREQAEKQKFKNQKNETYRWGL
jgi:hypothetical protein